MSKDIINVQIKGANLGFNDRAGFIFGLFFSWPSSGQGLNYPLNDLSVKVIKRILEVSGVQDWKDLPNTYVRIEADRSKVYRMGHIIKDEWIDFETLYEGN